jgi:UDP-2,3-diacylglucosamine hydrolase
MLSIIVSDVHIKRKDKAYFKFLELLRYTKERKADFLLIAGDLFEFLYKDTKYLRKRYKELFNLLDEIKRDTEVYYVYGNHDFNFHIKDIKTAGSFNFNIDGKQVFLTHGDGLDPGDYKYRFLKKVLRSFLFKIFYSLTPNFMLYNLANFGSFLSKNVNISSKKKSKGLKPYRDYAQNMLKNFDILIMGHTHVSEITNFYDKLYLNPGKFGQNYTFIELEDGVSNLKVFN